MSIAIRKVELRLNRYNQNWLCAITGPTGSGKTYCAITVAKMVDPNFTIENVVFDIEDCLRLINKPDLKKGTIIVFDEAGTGISSREWSSRQNIAFGKVIQTFRHLNIGLIFTSPNFDFIDKQIRDLVHTNIRISEGMINRNKGYVVVKWFKITPRKNDDPLIEYPRHRPEGRMNKMKEIRVWKPPKDILVLYEAKREEFSENLRKEMQMRLSEIKHRTIETMEERDLRHKKMVERVLKFPDYYMSPQKHITADMIIDRFKINGPDARSLKIKIEDALKQQALEKKGEEDKKIKEEQEKQVTKLYKPQIHQ